MRITLHPHAVQRTCEYGLKQNKIKGRLQSRLPAVLRQGMILNERGRGVVFIDSGISAVIEPCIDGGWLVWTVIDSREDDHEHRFENARRDIASVGAW